MKSENPAWSVVIVVANGHNNVLAIARGFRSLDPALPGGDSEEGDDSPAQTAQRELYEETGLKALEVRCFDRWVGERGQPVFVFYVPKFSGRRMRASSEGKPFWTQPNKLLLKSAYYCNEAQRVLEKLGEARFGEKSAKTG